MLNDILAGVRIGYPIIVYTLDRALPEALRKEQGALASWAHPSVQHPELTWPEEWAWLTGGRSSNPHSINLTIPYLGGRWDEAKMGKQFPPRGNFSTAFLKVGSGRAHVHDLGKGGGKGGSGAGAPAPPPVRANRRPADAADAPTHPPCTRLLFVQRITEESGNPIWGDAEKDEPPAKSPKMERWIFTPGAPPGSGAAARGRGEGEGRRRQR